MTPEEEKWQELIFDDLCREEMARWEKTLRLLEENGD